MAFYPDELSPIDRIRSLGKQTDSLPEIGSIKNRRQWKSLVLGKKDLSMNNFATIKEEKEEEMSSDGSQGANSNKSSAGALTVGTVAQKKITFAKPRKYITSRVSDRKEDMRNVDGSVPFTPLSSESSIVGSDGKKAELSVTSDGSKSNISDTKQQLIPGKSKELIGVSHDVIQNYALSDTPLESQWKDVFSENVGLSNWTKPVSEKASSASSGQGAKPKQEEKKKLNENVRMVMAASPTKRDSKGGKKKGATVGKNPSKSQQEIASPTTSKQKTEKGRTLNMKEVVNVYKNLAYGSKEEIKTFVENLPFVKDESKAEMDKNMLSMMNLKVLESKIKHFTKHTEKHQEATTSKEKKPKPEKVVKRNRKAHIERLARHKAVKVPSVLSKHPMKTPKESTTTTNTVVAATASAAAATASNTAAAAAATTSNSTAIVKPLEPKSTKSLVKNKEPWKYVGMESALNKTYFVYPAYPPSVNLKNTTTKNKKSAKGVEKGNASAVKASEPEPKVKAPQVVVKQKLLTGGGLRSFGPNVSGSASSKSMYRPSATTVCTVEFRPGVRQRTEEPPFGATNQSVLVYLHGTKAIHVKSPYSGKQFSRVKLFRKDERGMPLIKGIGRKAASKGCKRVSVRNISLPEKLTRVRSLDLLDFDEDIENITDFLRSQESPVRERQEAWQRTKKIERESWPKESPEEQDAAASRRQRRQRRTQQDLHTHLHLPHQHGTFQENLSPDSIMNEISKNIRHFQYLPDTEDNRKIIGQFFDELDQQIEASKKGALAFRKFPPPPGPQTFRPIPILGY